MTIITETLKTTEVPSLTPRQLDVLTLKSSGRTNGAVAKLLDVSRRTVDFHLANIYDALKVSNIIEALNVARRFGLIQ